LQKLNLSGGLLTHGLQRFQFRMRVLCLFDGGTARLLNARELNFLKNSEVF